MKNTIIIANNKDRPTPFSFSQIHNNSIKLKEKTKKDKKYFQIMKIINPVNIHLHLSVQNNFLFSIYYSVNRFEL